MFHGRLRYQYLLGKEYIYIPICKLVLQSNKGEVHSRSEFSWKGPYDDNIKFLTLWAYILIYAVNDQVKVVNLASKSGGVG